MAAEEFVKELQHITGREVTHINKFLAFVRLLFSGKGCLLGLCIFQEEESAPGFKAAKDRFALLLGGNTEGDYKLRPVMVYHSENLHILKGYV